MIVIFGHNSMRINIVERRFNLRKPWSKGKSLYWIENPFPRIINFFELDNPFSRIAIIRSLDFNIPLSRISIRSLNFHIQQFEGTNCNPFGYPRPIPWPTSLGEIRIDQGLPSDRNLRKFTLIIALNRAGKDNQPVGYIDACVQYLMTPLPDFFKALNCECP